MQRCGCTATSPTERGGYRLARLVRRCHVADDQVAQFRTPENLRFNLDLRTYPDCCMAFGLFIDGGANIGYFTLMAAKAVGPAACTHSSRSQTIAAGWRNMWR